MNKRFHSFSRRLTRRIVITLILMLAVVFACIFYLTVSTTKELNEFSFNSIMDVQSEIVEKVLYGVELSVSSSVGDMEQALATPETLYAAMEQELRNHPHVAGFFAALEPGYYAERGRWFVPCAARVGDSIVRQQVGGPQNDYLQEAWYRKALKSARGCWTEPYRDDAGSDELYCSYAIPLHDAEGRTVGVFGADVSLEWLHRQLQEMDEKANTKRIGIRNDSRFRSWSFVVDRDGTYIVHPDKRRILTDKFTAIDFTKEKEGTQEVEMDGETVLVCYEDLHNTDWTIGFVYHSRLIWLPVIIFSIVIFLAMLLGLCVVYVTLKKTTAEKAAMESELSIARGIQMAMVPKAFPAFPERRDIDIYGRMTPAKEVGGDLFDYLIRDEQLYFCIGDVSGKGVPAALVMAVTRSLFRTFAGEQMRPEQMMMRLNQTLCDGNETGWFVTMLIGTLDLKTGRLAYCNAGHIPPLLVGSEVGRLPLKPALAVGALPGLPYVAMETTLEPETTLFLFTDGLTEAMNAAHELFGDARAVQTARRLLQQEHCSPQSLTDAMEKAVKAFVGGAEQSDDLTLLAICLRSKV